MSKGFLLHKKTVLNKKKGFTKQRNVSDHDQGFFMNVKEIMFKFSIMILIFRP